MTFTPIQRHRPALHEPFCSTPPDSIRLTWYRPREASGQILVFWLGFRVAAKIGLTEKRELVSLLSDSSGPVRRIAIRPCGDGQFRASRRLGAYAVHADMLTSGELLGENGTVRGIIPAEELEFSPGMVAFPFVVRLIGDI